jgi:hypothetical protein
MGMVTVLSNLDDTLDKDLKGNEKLTIYSLLRVKTNINTFGFISSKLRLCRPHRSL